MASTKSSAKELSPSGSSPSSLEIAANLAIRTVIWPLTLVRLTTQRRAMCSQRQKGQTPPASRPLGGMRGDYRLAAARAAVHAAAAAAAAAGWAYHLEN